MKVRIVKCPQDSKFKAGDQVDATGAELDVLTGAGHEWQSESEWQARELVKARDQDSVKQAIVRAKEREAIPLADEKTETAMLEKLVKGNDPALVVQVIDGMAGKAQADLAKRLTQSFVSEGSDNPRISVESVDPCDAANGYVKAREPMTRLIRAGDWKSAFALSVEAGNIAQQHLIKAVDAGADFHLGRLVRATTATAGSTSSDPDSQLGYLSTGLILLRNLGFLMKKLDFITRMSTDLRNEPARFGEPIYTRYFTLPNLLTWVPGVGFTSDATTISDHSAGTTQASATLSGTAVVRTTSVPNATDVSVVMNMFKAVEIELPYSKMASTLRNLFAEQRGTSIYKLADAISTYVLDKAAASTWTGTVTSFVKALANFNISSIIDLKAAMDVAEIPDVGRFCILHTFYANKILQDTNLLNAKAILALLNKDLSEFESQDIPALFGLKPYATQYASHTSAGAYVAWTDPTSLGTTAITGFAGFPSSMIFVARVPQDWTSILNQLGIPLTAAVEIVTEPTSNLSVMVFKYADNGRMSVIQRVCLMWGAAQGDPRTGMLIKPA